MLNIWKMRIINRLRQLIARHINTYSEHNYRSIGLLIGRLMFSFSVVKTDPGSPEADEPEGILPEAFTPWDRNQLWFGGYFNPCVLLPVKREPSFSRIPIEISPDLVPGTIQFKNSDGSIFTIYNIGNPEAGQDEK